MTEPDAWRFRLKDCPQCQSGGWEVEQVKPTKDLELGNNSRHSLGYKEERVTEKEPLYSPDTIDQDLQKLEQEIMDREHGKLSYKEEMLVKSVLFLARQQFKEDAEALPDTENLVDKAGTTERDKE